MDRRFGGWSGLYGRRGHALAAALLLALTALSLLSAAGTRGKLNREKTGESTARRAALEAHRTLPLAFVRNRGQLNRRVLFSAHAGSASFFLTRREAVVALSRDSRGAALRLRFLGASASALVTGAHPSPGRVNYLIGNDPSRWHTNLPVYQEVGYRGLWPGIDMSVRGRGGALKYEFRLAPGADPARIRLAYRGHEALSLERSGALRVETALGVLRDTRPLSYQMIAGRRVRVASRFALGHGGAYGFALGAYDHRYPLVIDPGLVYSTYLGGTAGNDDHADYGYAIAVDGAGSAYVTGSTESRNFPTSAGAFDRKLSGDSEAFVTKLNVAGTRLAYSTLLGGAGDEFAIGIAVDDAGSAYVVGSTASKNFPTSAGAVDRSLNGRSDAFVTKLNAAGSGLAHSTYLGGAGDDGGSAVAVDAAGNAYVTGSTGSRTFPKNADAFDRNYNGGPSDAFVTKLNMDGSGLAYSTYLGGAGGDGGAAIAVDAAGSAYVAGGTRSRGFPTTAVALDVTYNGDLNDAFVTKLNATGSSLMYSTYLGGSGGPGAGGEYGSGIAVDGAGSAYVVGRTTSRNFPTSAGAFDRSYKGRKGEGFVTKLNAAGSALAYSTFLGGSQDDWPGGIAIGDAGSAYVAGETASSNFATTAGAFDRRYGSGTDAFVTKLNAAGSALAYSTFLGGSFSDTGSAIAVDARGRVYVAGDTSSENFPTTARAFDRRLGFWDAFVAKLILSGR